MTLPPVPGDDLQREAEDRVKTARERKAEAEQQRSERRSGWRMVAQLSTVGLTLALAVGIGIGLGWWLDQRFKTNGILVIVGALIGIGAGFRELIRAAMRASREQEESERRGPGGTRP